MAGKKQRAVLLARNLILIWAIILSLVTVVSLLGYITLPRGALFGLVAGTAVYFAIAAAINKAPIAGLAIALILSAATVLGILRLYVQLGHPAFAVFPVLIHLILLVFVMRALVAAAKIRAIILNGRRP